MATQCCFAAHEPEQRPPFYPDEPCQRFLEGEEPDRMATGANYDDKMADDETLRALDYIREMCLDRPCPNCKSEVIDKPQDDVRQCRGCGHVWGFDDTQNLEEFVREFARMEPCVVCDNDNLDEFEVVDNDGRQEMICRNCQSVQRQDRIVEDYDVVQPDQEGGYGNPDQEGCGNPEFDMRGPRELVCPFCPIMTDDFFEKQYEHDELVRAVCPSCSYVVYFKGQDDVRKAEGDDVLRAQEDYRVAHGNDDGWAQENNGRAQEHNGRAQENNGRAQENDVGWAQENNGRAQGNDVGWAQENNGRAHGNGVGWAQENNGRTQGNDVGWAHQDNGREQGNGVGWAQKNNGRARGNDGRWAQEGFDQDIRAPEDGINGRHRLTGRWRRRGRQDGEAGGNDKAHFFRPVGRAMKYMCVKPIAVARHALKECADSVIAEDETLVPRMRDMATNQGPIMAEQLGWTIGTAMGNVVFRTPEGAAFTGNVGSIVGRGFCNMVLHTMCNRRRNINARDGGY